MAVKTITIDMEAYRLLEKDKREGESFSKVIKRRMAADKTAANLLRHLDDIDFSEDAIDAMEEVVRSRKASITQPPCFD